MAARRIHDPVALRARLDELRALGFGLRTLARETGIERANLRRLLRMNSTRPIKEKAALNVAD